LLATPSPDPDGRSLAHPVLISDDWRRSELQDRDGARAVEVAIVDPAQASGSTSGRWPGDDSGRTIQV